MSYPDPAPNEPTPPTPPANEPTQTEAPEEFKGDRKAQAQVENAQPRDPNAGKATESQPAPEEGAGVIQRDETPPAA